MPANQAIITQQDFQTLLDVLSAFVKQQRPAHLVAAAVSLREKLEAQTLSR